MYTARGEGGGSNEPGSRPRADGMCFCYSYLAPHAPAPPGDRVGDKKEGTCNPPDFDIIFCFARESFARLILWRSSMTSSLHDTLALRLWLQQP